MSNKYLCEQKSVTRFRLNERNTYIQTGENRNKRAQFSNGYIIVRIDFPSANQLFFVLHDIVRYWGLGF